MLALISLVFASCGSALPRQNGHGRIDGLPIQYKKLAQENYEYLVVPVDYNLFKPNPSIVRQENLYIFVGMMHPNKGIFNIFEIAKRHPENEYLFIGSNQDDGTYDMRGLDDLKNVKYLGHKTNEELVNYYNRAKQLMILPTNGAVESASRVVFEAIFCGCDVRVACKLLNDLNR